MKPTKTFREMYPDETTWLERAEKSPFKIALQATDSNGQQQQAEHQEILKKCYWLLTAEYMGNNFLYKEPVQIDLQVFRLVYDRLPRALKRIRIQEEILKMSVDDLSRGGVTISSNMDNSNTATIDPLDASLPEVRSKTAATNTLAKIDALTKQFGLLVDGIWDNFIAQFKDLFITIILGTDRFVTIYNEDWED